MELNSSLEKRQFWKSSFFLVLPVIGQNVLNMIVTTADVVMLGAVGQTELAAASLANQIYFLLDIFFFGMASGVCVLTAQYWGRGEARTIERVLGIALRLAAAVALLFSLAALCIPEQLMRLFTPEELLIQVGAEYLRIMGTSYVLVSATLMYLNVMRSIERTWLSAVVYAISLVVNVTLNSLLIFGLLGFPKMGIKGAALATVIARVVEFTICMIDAQRNPHVRIRVRYIFARDKALFRDFLRYTLPALGNDMVWGVGFTMYSVIMGHLGSDVVAANSIAAVVRNIAKVVCNGLATGTAIIVGKALGQNLLQEARVYAWRMVKATILFSLLGGGLILLARPFVVNYGEITDQAREYLHIMIYISAYYVFGQALNTTLICGVFRAGGDSNFGLFCDIVDMWLFSVPLGLISAFVLKLPVMWVYFLIFLDEFAKIPFVIRRYKQEKWLRNITRDDIIESS